MFSEYPIEQCPILKEPSIISDEKSIDDIVSLFGDKEPKLSLLDFPLDEEPAIPHSKNYPADMNCMMDKLERQSELSSFGKTSRYSGSRYQKRNMDSASLWRGSSTS